MRDRSGQCIFPRLIFQDSFADDFSLVLGTDEQIEFFYLDARFGEEHFDQLVVGIHGMERRKVGTQVGNPERMIIDIPHGDQEETGELFVRETATDHFDALASCKWIFQAGDLFRAADDDDNLAVFFQQLLQYLEMAFMERLETTDE